MNQSESTDLLLDATYLCLRKHGYAGLTTRRVAELADTPLSQIHYHFGSKKKLVLSLLANQNAKLLERQHRMYSQEVPLWKRWVQGCEFLDDDLDSGYVRVLQEMIAAGWHDPEIALEAKRLMQGWYDAISQFAGELEAKLGGVSPFTRQELTALLGNVFLGSEEVILLGFDEERVPTRKALRSLGTLIRLIEEGAGKNEAP